MGERDVREAEHAAKRGASESETHLPVLALIETLEQACAAGTSTEGFRQELLRSFVAMSEAAYGAYWCVDGQTRTIAVVCELMPRVSQAGAQSWRAPLGELAQGVVSQSIIRYRAVSEPADRLLTGQTYMALGFPVRGEPSISGCITVVVRQDNPILSDAGVALLRLLAEFGFLYSSTRAAGRFEGFYKALSGVWDVLGEALAFTNPVEMAQVLANRSRMVLKASRVSMGFVKREKVTVKVISGEDIVDPRSNVVKLIQAAQTEVVVSGEPGLYRADAPDSQAAEQLTRNPQQERLAREGGSSAVYSVPLRKEKDLVAVWTFEFTETPLTEDLRQVIDVMAGQASPILELARQNDMGPLARTGRSAAKTAKWLFGKEHPWRKVAMAAAIGLAAVAVFGKIDFNVTASCRLEPSFKRIYAAPFNTTIKAAPVRPGDTVSAGQTVVQLDREEVELQLREAQSKRTSAEKEKSTYLAQQKIPQWAEAEARHEALGAEIELLQRHLAKTTIKALDAGIVISGDLRQDIDRQVRMGEQLMEIAPLSELVLEVELDQGDVSYIQPGQSGRFTTKARPSVSTDFAVTKIHPTPEARSGASVYVAEATVANPADAAYANADDPSSANAAGWLRPGMEGAAKIKVDRRNVTWVLTRKLINWLRLRLWW